MDGNYAIHVSTDKPLYKPGETVYGRGVVLHVLTRRPPSSRLPHLVRLRVLGPRGETFLEGRLKDIDDTVDFGALKMEPEPSVIPFSFTLPKDAAGGDYTVRLDPECYPCGERTIEVRAYRAPRLRIDLDFIRQSYGAGEAVAAMVAVARAEGGVPAGATATAVATLDGQEIHRSVQTVGQGGRVDVGFVLPARIHGPGDGSLSVSILDGGVQESAVRTLPIARADKITVRFFPEGGDLFVADAPQRVYVEGKSTNGRPADVSGVIIDAAGAEVAVRAAS